MKYTIHETDCLAPHRLAIVPYIMEILLEGGEYDKGLAKATDIEAALDACDNKISQAELTVLREILNKVLKGDAVTVADTTAAEAAMLRRGGRGEGRGCA